MELRRINARIISRVAIALLVMLIVFKPEVVYPIITITLHWLEVMFNKMIDYSLFQISTRF